MKNFLIKGLYFLPIPLVILAVNYYVDPANLFDSKYERGIVNHLVRGDNVTNILNYDERLVQSYFIKKMSKCPSIIALGSSRVMLINSSVIHNKNFINNGVSGALLEDDIAIYNLYEKKGCKIRKILFGLEPYILNDNHNQVGWKSLAPEYQALANKLLNNKDHDNTKIIFPEFNKYMQLLSTSYFKASIDYSIRGVRVSYKPTKNTANKGFTKLSDGSIYYDATYRNYPADKVNEMVLDTLKKNEIYGLKDYSQISKNYTLLFTRFIDYLQKQDIEVEFFLSPYHPIVYDHLKKNTYYDIVFESENYFRNYAKTHRIKVFGSYNPQQYDLDNSYFYDGYHCKLKGIEKILANASGAARQG